MSDDSNNERPEAVSEVSQTGPATEVNQIVIAADGRRMDPGVAVKPYDFRNPVFLSEVELRRLRLVHEDFVRYLGARLSLFLRMEFGIKITSLGTVTYSKFTESLPDPTHLCLFKAEPLAGIGVLDINPGLALTIADRLLGGRGQAVKAARNLTEIEIGLLEDVILIVLEEWCGLWRQEQELSPLVVGHENNACFLQTSPRDSAVLALAMEIRFGDCIEAMQIGIPFYTIEPLLRRMHARQQKNATAAAEKKSFGWQASYDGISLPVRAEWSALELSLRDLSCLRVGDVVELPGSLIGETHVLFNGTPKFVGTAGLDGDRVAVQLNHKLSTQEAPLAGKTNGN